MDPSSMKFGRGPRELTGGMDLISVCQLLSCYEFFCKKPLLLLFVGMGNTEIRKGEGILQMDQLIEEASSFSWKVTNVQPFDIDVLREAFQLRETNNSSCDLPPSEKGIPPIIATESRSGLKDKKKDKEYMHSKKKKRKYDGDEDLDHINWNKIKVKIKSSKINQIVQ